MAKTVVIYHSGYGHTQRVAQFVAQGANAALIAIDADGNITHLHGHGLLAVQEICRCNIQALVHQCLERQSGRWFHHLCQSQW